MTLANDSFILTPSGSGTSLPTQLISSKELSVMIGAAGGQGNLRGTVETYFMHTDYWSADGAGARDMWDFFNADAAPIRINGIWMIARNDNAITFGSGSNAEVSMPVQWFKTTAVGTGGTALTYGPNSAGSAFSPKDTTNTTLPAGVTARTTPSGGATAGAYLFTSYHSLKETRPHSGLQQFLDLLPYSDRGEQDIILAQNEGIKAVQALNMTAIISAGNAGTHTLMQFERLV